VTAGGAVAPGDQARVSVQVGVAPDEAFRIFTEEIDLWWRRGYAYRVAGTRRGLIHIEPRDGGRLFESFDDDAGDTTVVETGRVTDWSPPGRLVFEWRAQNFAPGEKTEVEVVFQARGEGTLVTVTHRGWSAIRPDHPARHGKETEAFVRMMGMWWGDLLGSLRVHVRRRRGAAAGGGSRAHPVG
jgi:uncharacterized protein YndB with AHSA1/START domain